jgi:hypothetical protein
VSRFTFLSPFALFSKNLVLYPLSAPRNKKHFFVPSPSRLSRIAAASTLSDKPANNKSIVLNKHHYKPQTFIFERKRIWWKYFRLIIVAFSEIC